MTDPSLPLAVSLGDPAGIGPEITAKCWLERADRGVPEFVAIGDPASVRAVSDVPLVEVESPEEGAARFGEGLPFMGISTEDNIVPGRPSHAGARCALDALELAVGLTRSGSACAVVTGPVSKSQLYAIGFTHPGQTEFVAERCGVAKNNVAMMLAGPTLRAVPVTVHVPLREVADSLSVELIAARGRTALRGLIRNFGIEHPRLAVTGLNPHAGEDATLGTEDHEFVAPAVQLLREEGWHVTGPHPADTMFHAAAREKYDAALAMYHDQALIPLKALHFEEGVNITLGLPIVRTSPDHGTAFDIAGLDRADPAAMAAAMRCAITAAGHRQQLAAAGRSGMAIGK